MDKNRTLHHRNQTGSGKIKKRKMVLNAALCLAFTLGTAMPALADGGSFQQDAEGRWMYITQDGAAAAPGWVQADGNWYRIGDDGFRQTGWILEGEAWYYLDEAGVMATGWKSIDGKHYYFRDNGTMQNSTLRKDDTQYTFNTDGSFSSARKVKNTGGGAFPVAFYNTELQALSDNLNELKEDAFEGDEEEDYYEDDKKNYDKDASYVINGKLQEIAEHRLSMARKKGYGSGKIPDEGTLADYLKSIGYNSGRRMMEVYLMNCDGADAAEEKLLRSHDSDEKKRSDRAVYYKEMGIAHEEVNGKDYFMVVFMR